MSKIFFLGKDARLYAFFRRHDCALFCTLVSNVFRNLNMTSRDALHPYYEL